MPKNPPRKMQEPEGTEEPQTTPGGEKPTFTANQLRWLAEAADGFRGDRECVAVYGGKYKNPTVVSKKDSKGRKELQIGVFTPWARVKGKKNGGEKYEEEEAVQGGMRGGVRVRLSYGPKSSEATIDLESDIDAVFLTQTAVDKFVLPYYMRMEYPDWVDEKKNELFQPGVVAAVHANPSITTALPKTLPVIAVTDQGVVTELKIDFNAL